MASPPKLRAPDFSPVIARLEASRPLLRAESELISELAASSSVIAPGGLVMGEGDPVSRPLYVLSGWASRQRTLPDGRRQIISFVLPGEGVGLCRRFRSVAFTDTVALTRLVVADAGRIMSETCAVALGLRDVLDEAAVADELRLITHVVRLGRQSAYERFCSLVVELGDRLETVGLGSRDGFPLPVTQEVLSDALGLSVVHINRTLQQIRRDGLIEIRAGVLRIIDRAGVERAAGVA